MRHLATVSNIFLRKLAEGFFLTKGLNPGLLHCRKILYWLSHKGRERLPTPVFWPGDSMDCIVHGVAKSRTWLNDFHFHFSRGTQDETTILLSMQLFYKLDRIHDKLQQEYSKNCDFFFGITNFSISLSEPFKIWSIVNLQHCVSFRCTAKWFTFLFLFFSIID